MRKKSEIISMSLEIEESIRVKILALVKLNCPGSQISCDFAENST